MVITNNHFLKVAYDMNGISPEIFTGKVLVLGLGNAFIIKQIKCTQLKIVESDADTIKKYGKEFDVDHADAFEYVPKQKYDFIFLDIWYQSIDQPTLDTLLNKYKKHLKKKGKLIYLPLIVKTN